MYNTDGFFASQERRDAVQTARHRYPRKKKSKEVEKFHFKLGEGVVKEADDKIARRIMGFGLGFEKIFATTSIKLPVSAYTLFVELHPLHCDTIYSRCFNGLHTVYDLKKWIYEVTQVPMDAYTLSYAEPGKAALTDQLRLLTTQDSLDTRTLATTRAMQTWLTKGIPGVHSIDDIGVTRLYVRLKCRVSGRLLIDLPPYLKYKTIGDTDPTAEGLVDPDGEGVGGQAESLFDTRGFEMYSAARVHGGTSEIARIYISMDEEPSEKLKLARNVLKNLDRTHMQPGKRKGNAPASAAQSST